MHLLILEFGCKTCSDNSLVTRRLVAACHLEQNPEYRHLVAEKARAGPGRNYNLPVYSGNKELLEQKHAPEEGEGPSAAETGSTALDGAAAVTTADAGPSHALFPQDVEPGATPKMTLIRLKRCNVILEYMDRHKVINGLVELCKV